MHNPTKVKLVLLFVFAYIAITITFLVKYWNDEVEHNIDTDVNGKTYHSSTSLFIFHIGNLFTLLIWIVYLIAIIYNNEKFFKTCSTFAFGFVLIHFILLVIGIGNVVVRFKNSSAGKRSFVDSTPLYFLLMPTYFIIMVIFIVCVAKYANTEYCSHHIDSEEIV